MSTNLPIVPAERQAGDCATRPKKAHWIRTSRAAQSLAQKLGKSEHYIAKLLRCKTGKNIEVAEYISEMRAQGMEVQALRYFAPIEHAMKAPQPQPLTLELVESEKDALHAADVAQYRFACSKNDRDLSLDIRATERAAVRILALLDALKAEEQRRMGQS